MGVISLGSSYSAGRGRVEAGPIGHLETRREDRRKQRGQWSRQIQCKVATR